jgi:hypothetical protein
MTSYISSKNIIKYLNDNNFPYTDYDASIVNNNFIEKYKNKKKYLYNTIINIKKTDSDLLYYKSLPIISNFQKFMKQKKLETYITGGSCIRLHTFLNSTNPLQQNEIDIISTTDFDMILFTDKKDVTIKTIITYLMHIMNSYYLTINKPKYMTLQISLILPFNNILELHYVLKYLLNKNFDLYQYKYKPNNNEYNFTFIILFEKVFCIKLNIRFLNMTKNFINNDNFGIIEIYNYYYDFQDNYKLKNIVLPIEIMITRKSSQTTELLKDSIIYNNNIFYVFNKKTMLYILSSLQYKYKYLVNNRSIIKKKEEHKNVRDYKRLLFFLKICFNSIGLYNNTKINENFNKLIENISQFNIAINKITNFSIIDEIFSKKV